MSLSIVARQPMRTLAELAELFQNVSAWLSSTSAVLLQEKIFAPVRSAAAIATIRRQAYTPATDPDLSPCTIVSGRPCVGGIFAGMQVLAIRGDVERKSIRRDGRSVGYVVEGPGQRLLTLAQIGAPTTRASSGASESDLERMFDEATRLLAANGFSFADVARTWIYLDDIISRYPQLNRARDRCFERAGMPLTRPDWSYPASTGIQGVDGEGNGCFLDLIAAQHATGEPAHSELTSPLQCSAQSYGSNFARGVSLPLWQSTLLMVSGTASIDSDGLTCHVGDPDRQIRLSCEAANGVFRGANSSLQNAATGVLYFKSEAIFEAWKRSDHEEGLRHFIPIYADICREDLLFEIEGMAFR